MESLKLPNVPEVYLDLNYISESELQVISRKEIQNGLAFPLAATEIKFLPLKCIHLLSIKSDLKDTIEVELNIKNVDAKYLPGDTVGVIPSNNQGEVKEILSHIGLSDKIDDKCILSVKNLGEGQSKKTKSLPPHLPKISTLGEIFKTCVEIRGPPKKVFLRALAEYASDPVERGKLLKLSSREGAAEYESLFSLSSGNSPGFGLLQFFKAFPSCTPPVSVLLQHLPRLRARPYSIASSPLVNEKCLRLIFSVYKEPASKGVCTSWLEGFLPVVALEDRMSSLSINEPKKEVPLFFRKSVGFCLPDDLSVPIILIGPGTGVAPYIGFLEHLSALRKSDKSMECEVWLFYGSRYPGENLLYEKYLKKFVESGTLSRLFLSFSQYSESFEGWNGSKYVQDSITELDGKFVEQMIEKSAFVYVSGDGTKMFQVIREKIASLIKTHKGITLEDASSMLKTLITKKKYLEDMWI